MDLRNFPMDKQKCRLNLEACKSILSLFNRRMASMGDKRWGSEEIRNYCRSPASLACGALDTTHFCRASVTQAREANFFLLVCAIEYT